MLTDLKWEKGLLDNEYKLYSDGKQLGSLINNLLSKTDTGIINNREVLFRKENILKNQFQIIDSTEDKVIGEIIYNEWMNKATITIEDKTVKWKSNNLSSTQWRLFNEDGFEIKYSGSFTGGQINSSTDDLLLILCGLYLTHYFWQITITVLIITLMPLMTTILLMSVM